MHKKSWLRQKSKGTIHGFQAQQEFRFPACLPVSQEGHTGHSVFWRVGWDRTSGPRDGRGGKVFGTRAYPVLLCLLHRSSWRHLMLAPSPLRPALRKLSTHQKRVLPRPGHDTGTLMSNVALRGPALPPETPTPGAGGWGEQGGLGWVLVPSPRNRSA